MSFYWHIRPEEAWGALLDSMVDQIEREIVAFAEELTDEIATWMRTEARWTDRTGEARAGLYSGVIHLLHESVTIFVSHGPAIEYAWYLETVRGGSYGIIGDTVDHFAPLVFHRVREIMQRVSRGQ